jgi:hypothetical protein
MLEGRIEKGKIHYKFGGFDGKNIQYLPSGNSIA